MPENHVFAWFDFHVTHNSTMGGNTLRQPGESRNSLGVFMRGPPTPVSSGSIVKGS